MGAILDSLGATARGEFAGRRRGSSRGPSSNSKIAKALRILHNGEPAIRVPKETPNPTPRPLSDGEGIVSASLHHEEQVPDERACPKNAERRQARGPLASLAETDRHCRGPGGRAGGGVVLVGTGLAERQRRARSSR